MGIEDIKRWQWILVGIVAGLGLGWVWSGSESSGTARLINQLDFEREIVRAHPTTKQPLIRDVVLEPITTDYRGAKVQPVTFKRLQQGAKTGKTYYMPAQFIATLPYKPMVNPPASTGGDLTLSAYLAELRKKNSNVNFSYGWWNERPAALALWTVGATVVVGGIWPTLLGMMTGAGLGGSRTKAKKEDYFDRFSHTKEPEKARPALAVSESERQRLDDMNAVLERDLAAGAIGMTTAEPRVAVAAGDVRKLEGGPLEVAQVAKNSDDDDEIEIKGEYYPVMIHHKKHHEESDHSKPD